MRDMLEKTYQPAAVEPRITRTWDDAGAFRAGAGAEPGAPTFCIVIPPPNVTGSLHMGHAFNNTIQDILCRFERMRGRDVLWQPGMDHAGIATQMVVERQLMERQLPGRREMGREAFIERVWEWKNESGGTIQRQLKRLGASCDWSRERFTMDEGLSAAVRKVFVALHRQGLIYRDKRLVNWDPKFQTAISDLEVVPVETKGNLWHFRYPVEGEDGLFITVATTRPETMLGDTAVAVHPDDERYKALIGRNVVLPLVGRRIPIVADSYADPETGSGAVKITPAHDFNDFEVGRRHDLPLINVLDAEAQLLLKENAAFLEGAAAGPDLEAVLALDGFDRFTARKRVVALMEERERVEKIEPHLHTVPHGDRSNAVVEPWLTDQWYVDAAKLAVPAMEVVRDGKTRFVPESWSKTFFNWMENIEPWCVSRQLWWGHQIPAWYGSDGQAFVEETEEEALAAAARHYGMRVSLVQDEDVLDTWFSSALWPFSTLGWPDETPELARYYPTSVLVTGFDIIFFWVARMMMSGLHFMKETPFRDVYIHALVRDEKGAKMSKSKGNVIDPLELMDQFGADAMRFTLAAFAAQGRDVKLSKGRVEGYRNFANKLWNAARFAEMNGCEPVAGFAIGSAKLPLNRWIAGEAERTATAVEQAIVGYRFNDAASAVYRFVWNVFCDWYLELAKPVLSGPDCAEKDETRAACAWTLGVILKLLHPFMPFITEELWTRFGDGDRLLVLSRWPELVGNQDDAAEAEIGWLVDLVSGIRSVRAEMNVPVAATIPLVLLNASDAVRDRAARLDEPLRRLARLSSVAFSTGAAPKGSVQILSREGAAALPLEGVIDLAAEALRLTRELERLDGEIRRIDGKLSNESFVARAPEEVVEGEREKRAAYEERKVKVSEALSQLTSAEA